VGCGSASLTPHDDGGVGGAAGAAGARAGGAGGRGGAGAGAAGTVGSSWCAMQIAAPSVAASDTSCVDFDEGALPSGSWTSKVAGGATQALTGAHASSLPQSWQVTVPAGSAATQATLTWKATGSKPVATVTVAADVSPLAAQGVAAWTGSVDLLCVTFGSGHACLDYTMDADTGFASGYTGFYLSLEYDGGGAMYSEKPVTGSLATGIWTRVQLQVTASGDQVVVTLGGSATAPATGYFDPDTTVQVSVGPNASGAVSGWSGYIDNVVTTVTRSL